MNANVSNAQVMCIGLKTLIWTIFLLIENLLEEHNHK